MAREFTVTILSGMRHIDEVATPHGAVVAYMEDHLRGPITFVPGIYRGYLPSNPGSKRMIVDTVPKEQRPDISRSLRENNYAEPILYL